MSQDTTRENEVDTTMLEDDLTAVDPLTPEAEKILTALNIPTGH